jgi:hypothetical protein
MQSVDEATLPLDELFALPDPGQVAELPVLDAADMAQNIRRLTELIAGMREDLMKVPDVAAMVQALEQMERAPVWVVSTGRCGTLALDKWLSGSNQATPFHRNMWFQESRPLVDISIHRRRLAFWRVLTGKFDEASIWHDVLYLAHLIAPDVNRQADRGESWIMTNHGVAPWAAYLLGLCPRLRVLHLRRRPEDTFNLCLWNGHWSNQLVPMSTRDVGGAEGILAEPMELSMGSQIAFFLAATETIGAGIMDTIPEANGLFLESETLYRAEVDSWEALTEFTGITDLSFESFQSNYAKKTNAKAARKFVPSDEYRNALDGRLRLVMSAFKGRAATVEPGAHADVHRAWATQLFSNGAVANAPGDEIPAPFFTSEAFGEEAVPKPGTGQTRCFAGDRGSRERTDLQAAYRAQLGARPEQSRR